MDGMREQGRKTLHEAQAFARSRNVDAEIVQIDMAGKHPADIIIEQAKLWPAGLIVMGTHGRRGMNRMLMGSDAEMTLRSAAVPVMVVREEADSTWTPSAAVA